MKSRWILVLSAATALIVTACLSSSVGPDPLPTGVIESAGPGGNPGTLLVRDVKGSQYASMILVYSDGTEILIEQPGGTFQAGSIMDLKPGTRIRFETGSIAAATIPVTLGVLRIWVVR